MAGDALPICVIFDLDGTLVDSETIAQQAFLDLLPDLDCGIDALLHRYRGMQLDWILEDLPEWAGVSISDDFQRRYRAHESSLLANNLRPMPGALEALGEIEHPTCLASGGPPVKIYQSLATTGLDRHFGDRVFSSYTVRSWKPDPGLFLHAAQKMGFEPADCVVVEDSAPGIQAALAADMHAVHYTGAGSVQTITPTAKLENLLDLPRMLDAFIARRTSGRV